VIGTGTCAAARAFVTASAMAAPIAFESMTGAGGGGGAASTAGGVGTDALPGEDGGYVLVNR
jgi:hypothetical protein